MLENDIKILIDQLKHVAMNKATSFEVEIKSEELKELQNVISYFAQSITESNDFLNNMAMGNLDAIPPNRHNFMAGSLKELHAGLKHIAWQAHQVAQGDYSQRVSFLGEFSESFNQMIAQLEEREKRLKNQTVAISKSNALMVSVMDLLSDWIVVTKADTGKVLYVNHSANQLFYNPKENKSVCGLGCQLLEKICSQGEIEEEKSYDYYCHRNGKTLYIKSNAIFWNEELAYVNIISDVTLERGEHEKLKKMAFRDELTGLFNRRYCMKQLKEFIKHKKTFALCMIDLDGLKSVNDKFGHLLGDEYIITVSESMKQICRKTDIACRLGGDEMVVIFPECSEDSATTKMSNLAKNILSIKKEYPMSISYGVVFADGYQNLQGNDLLKMADEKMYKIKKMRNKARK